MPGAGDWEPGPGLRRGEDSFRGAERRRRWRHQALLVLESVLEASRHQREESGETRSRDRAELPDHGGSVSPASVRPLPPLRQPGQGYTDHT